jgi:FKBP-type peptidyl-prolyl cis-trans isomerase (trigger factor)
VIEQRYGSQVRQEVPGRAAAHQLRRGDPPGAGAAGRQPDIRESDVTNENGEIRYTATFEVVPDFGDIDVSQLEFDRVTATVEESDIDAMLETLRQQRQEWHPVTRPAQAGDLVRVETFATKGEERFPAEGWEQGATVIGSNAMLPAMESQLAGLSKGDERELEVEFPADWRIAALAGEKVKVTVKVDQVAESFVPEIDEAFIKSFGVRSGKLDVFRKEVRANLERELKGHADEPPARRGRLAPGEHLRQGRDAAAPGRVRGPPAGPHHGRECPLPGPGQRGRVAGALHGPGAPARRRRPAGRRDRPPQRAVARPGARARDHAADRLDLRGSGPGH